MDKKRVAAALLERLRTCLYDYPVIKVFKGTWDTIYMYKDTDSSYSEKVKFTNEKLTDDLMEEVYDYLSLLFTGIPQIKFCRLSKKAAGYRIRADVDCYAKSECLGEISHVLSRVYDSIEVDENHKFIYTTPEKKCVHEKKGKQMGNFSLSDLKDAVIDKVTHLDRKTVTILAILALLLLIVGKYQTIKDILIGIKDKVKRSKNFKAMVEDGTKAVNSLKKIVGIKDKGVADAEA